MFEPPKANLQEVVRRISDNLRKADMHLTGLKKLNTTLMVTGLTTSGLTTLFTGVTAMRGPLIGGDDVGGWQLACVIAAALGFLTTLCMGLNQQLQVAERLSKATECVGRLKALDVAIVAGSRSEKDIVAEFENIVRAYPEPLR